LADGLSLPPHQPKTRNVQRYQPLISAAVDLGATDRDEVSEVNGEDCRGNGRDRQEMPAIALKCGEDLETHWRWKGPKRGKSRRQPLKYWRGRSFCPEANSFIETHYLLDATIDDGEPAGLVNLIFSDEGRLCRGPDNLWDRVRRGAWNETATITRQKFPLDVTVFGGIQGSDRSLFERG
jgi:hypothetical protein